MKAAKAGVAQFSLNSQQLNQTKIDTLFVYICVTRNVA